MSVLNKEEPDFIPVAPMINIAFASKYSGISTFEYVLNNEMYARAQIYCQESLGYDWIWNHQTIQGITEKEKNSIKKFPNYLLLETELGTILRVPERGSISIEKPALENKMLGDLDVPDPYNEERAEPLTLMLEKKDVFVCGDVLGPFTLAGTWIRGLELFLEDLILNPDFAKEILDFSYQYSLSYSKAQEEKGAHGILIKEPSSTLISPKHFKEFCLPYLKKLIADIDVPTILHICGDARNILEMVEKIGADCLSVESSISPRDIREDIVFWGNLDVTNVLMKGKEKVREESERLIGIADRNFILSSSCVVPAETPVESISEMIRVSRFHKK